MAHNSLVVMASPFMINYNDTTLVLSQMLIQKPRNSGREGASGWGWSLSGRDVFNCTM